ncbi:hypothetical protein [Luteitalea sp. TBR-22]|uniref:hypothetical protein n=1 Tax=Luteitalea sp. TBR-22 TaxID=2802971 RepID=UPI001EF68131|nr:hypothetical protein [Luteitalea sp. TBR-22]
MSTRIVCTIAIAERLAEEAGQLWAIDVPVCRRGADDAQHLAAVALADMILPATSRAIGGAHAR